MFIASWARAAYTASVLGTGLAFMSSEAHGLEPVAVASIRHHSQNWTFVPATLGGQVVGIVGWADSATVVPGNMTVAWFERLADGGWQAWGWSGATLGQAAAYSRQSLGGLATFRDGATHRLSVEFDAVAPEPVTGGLFDTDPLQEVVPLIPDPAGTVEAFAQSGWSVAPTLSASLVEPVVGCPVDVDPTFVLMNQLAEVFETALVGSSTIDPNCAWPCSGCTVTYTGVTPVTPPTWTVSTRVVGERRYCKWCRSATATASYTGLTWVWCNSCPATQTVMSSAKLIS